MSSLMEDLDQLMMPYRCKFDKALTTESWHEWYVWMNDTYDMDAWYIEKNEVWFKREKDLTLFMLRWL